MGSEKDSESPRSTSLHAAAPDPKCRNSGRRRRLTFHSVFSASGRSSALRVCPKQGNQQGGSFGGVVTGN
ncbi:hypothetical protein H8958_005052 [Nasalis larvatus]